MIDTSPERGHDRNGHTDGHVHEAPPHAGGWEAQQHLMSRWIELQMRQVEISGRFLETQERITLASLGRADTADAAAIRRPPSPSSTNGTGRHPVTPATPLATRPGPALPALPVRPAGNTASPRPAPSGDSATRASVPERPAEPRRAAPAALPATPAVTPDGAAGAPPPTEQFRRDLIAAVAERTGYPVEMLKEDALLEADLGIDSIKTVEIFGSLTDYHRFMPGGGGFDEELLAEFSQLKTLGDIIAMYDRGRTGGLTGTPQRAPSDAATTTGVVPARVDGTPPAANGQSAAARPLERLEVRPVPVPPADAQKKNESLTTSS